jgi:hypothetical protein
VYCVHRHRFIPLGVFSGRVCRCFICPYMWLWHLEHCVAAGHCFPCGSSQSLRLDTTSREVSRVCAALRAPAGPQWATQWEAKLGRVALQCSAGPNPSTLAATPLSGILVSIIVLVGREDLWWGSERSNWEQTSSWGVETNGGIASMTVDEPSRPPDLSKISSMGCRVAGARTLRLGMLDVPLLTVRSATFRVFNQ